MKNFAISGSWRNSNKEVRQDVERVVKEIIIRWDAIVTWWALGVDYFATEVALLLAQSSEQIKIFLPIKLQDFCKHYRKRAQEWVISDIQANMITSQLERVFNKYPESILDETAYKTADKESYYMRNGQIINACDVLYAFQVNGSKWTQDAIDKAKKLWKEVFHKKYRI